MQPYFFPYIGYFQLINSVDIYILLDNLDFIKDGWVNRNRIYNKHTMTYDYIMAPLDGKSSNKKINEILIHKKYNWRKKILNKISHNYSKSKYYHEVLPLIEKMVCFDTPYISEFNINAIKEICKFLNIGTKIKHEDNRYLQLEGELATIYGNEDSEFYDTKYPLKVIRVVELCRLEGANIFYNAPGGKDLYDKSIFKNFNISVNFVLPNDTSYPQMNDVFIPNLSIIDIMMNNSVDDIEKMLNDYTLR